MLALVEIHAPLDVASAGTSVTVAVLAAVFATLALRASRRRGNPSLRMVGIAFLVFAAKNFFSAYNVLTHLVPHDAIELTLSLFDLAIMGLLFWPFLTRATRRRA